MTSFKIQFKMCLNYSKKLLAVSVDISHILLPSRLHDKGSQEFLNSPQILTQPSQQAYIKHQMCAQHSARGLFLLPFYFPLFLREGTKTTI